MSRPAAPLTRAAADRAAAEAVLARAQSARQVVQDFVPLSESLEWQLGQEYLRLRGNKAFLSDARPVPFVVNNDGSLSRAAAHVFFASLRDAEEQGELPAGEDIFVLELGIGVGLFARFLLDVFRDLCWGQGKDYYDRLTYVAADRSQRMLLDVARNGVLADHPGRYVLRLVDALEPEKALLPDALFADHAGPPLRAVFLNYLLDCLPAAALEFEGERVRQLHVRTCVARNVRLEDHTDLTAEDLADRAKLAAQGDATAQREILEVYGLLASEYDYRPVDPDALPYGDFLREYSLSAGKRVLHNHGALRSLERLLALTHPAGFVLANDYGQTQLSREDEFEHQRFSLATFVGVNFPLVQAYFGGASEQGHVERLRVVAPVGEGAGIHTRLIARRVGERTRSAFHDGFDRAARERREGPLRKARECVRVGRFELAAGYYQEALRAQPGSWVLLSEAAQFLIFSLRDVKGGVDLAKLAVRLNPSCSAELWNTLGDGLFEWGRLEEAGAAYQKALRVSEADVRARYNLAWVYQRLKDYHSALRALADALALDRTGEYRERLLQKQQEVLAQLAGKNQQEYLLLINLVSKYAPPAGEGAPSPERGGVVTEAGAARPEASGEHGGRP